MAVNYSTQPYATPGNQLPFYSSQQQLSPTESVEGTTTTNNVSPTSPRMPNYLQYQLPNQFRQLRPPKSPLYVPAVLRPTERHPRPSPLTPPKSLQGSLDSLRENEADKILDDGRSPLDIALESDWIADEDIGEVTGPPTRDHWKPDDASPSCDSPKCRSSFNVFNRKHHCRHCGHIFCADHTNYTIPLNQEARFHPDGAQVRACETCHRQYQKWDVARSIHRKNSENSQESDSGPKSPPVEFGRHISPGMLSPQRQIHEQVATSVPKDWAWSTF